MYIARARGKPCRQWGRVGLMLAYHGDGLLSKLFSLIIVTSVTNKNRILKSKTNKQTNTNMPIPAWCSLSHGPHSNKEMTRSCKCPNGDAKNGYSCCQILYADHQDSSPINSQIHQTQLHKCGSSTSSCHRFFVACINLPINFDQMLWINMSLN